MKFANQIRIREFDKTSGQLKEEQDKMDIRKDSSSSGSSSSSESELENESSSGSSDHRSVDSESSSSLSSSSDKEDKDSSSESEMESPRNKAQRRSVITKDTLSRARNQVDLTMEDAGGKGSSPRRRSE